MIPPLDKIQENLLRFRYIDNSLHFLSVVCEQSSSPFSATIFHKYASVDLVNFLDHYDSFLGLLEKKEKTLVLSMSPFLEEIFKNREELKRIRNKWIAHIINQGDFVTELSKPVKHVTAEDMIIMINGVNLFSLGLEVIFPRQTDYILDNFTKEVEEIMIDSSFSNETIQIIINGKIGIVNAKFKIHDCNYQFPLKRYNIKTE